MKKVILIIMTTISLGTNAQNPEKNISESFPFTQKKITVNDIQMNYYEKGEGNPILYLHGIPVNSYLWRNIVPITSTIGRSIAVDLAGYGQSDIPTNQNYSIQNQYDYLKGFIDSLKLEKITLVVNDLGSLLGLKFAIENPEKIERIVFIEAAFMPTEQWYKQLTFKQKIIFMMFRNEKMAYNWIVKKNKIPKMMVEQMVVRKLSEKEKEHYLTPYNNDIERRKVMLEGPGPATFPKKGRTLKKGDFADELNKVAKGVIKLNDRVPFLILYANPGVITKKQALQYAQINFKNLTMINLGKGKHFLQEDHPTAIGNNIKSWINETK
jgi:haloalkane dehalogenase